MRCALYAPWEDEIVQGCVSYIKGSNGQKNMNMGIRQTRTINMALHLGFDNQYKLVFTFFMIACFNVSDTQWLSSLVLEVNKATHF